MVPAAGSNPWRVFQQGTLLLELWLPADIGLDVVFEKIQDALLGRGINIASCGACQHWQHGEAHLGWCRWNRENRPLTTIAEQTILASPCDHFLAQDVPRKPDLQNFVQPRHPQKTEKRLSWWQRVFHKPASDEFDGNEERFIEQSGKRPGTIPCLVCPGRMANLGAQKSKTPEKDDRTFSVWRCRECYSYFLNDYTDKWVRLDSLEVVDVYFRLAPQEAVECLAVIEETQNRKRTVAEMQEWMGNFLQARSPARREVRHSR